MAIQITANGFRLDTAHTSYFLERVAGDYLAHTYYGARIGADSALHLIPTYFQNYNAYPADFEGAEASVCLQTLPQEYGTTGGADFRTAPILIRHTDGSATLDLRYESYRLFDGTPDFDAMPFPYQNEGEDVDTLEVTLVDAPSGVRAVLGYTVFEEKDIIVRYTRVQNGGDGAVRLCRVASAQLDFVRADFDFIHLYGAWAQERQISRRPLAQGKQGFASLRGTSSHNHSPFFVLCDHTATETAGDAYGVHLMYSGCHETTVERSVYEDTRAQIGIASDSFEWTLCAGQSFTAPAAILAYSEAGLGGMSRRLHTFIRENICPAQWKGKPRPILINNWEATYFNFDEEKLLSIARAAAPLGIELFVMDDGWFGHRTSDNCSLGDWTPDRTRLPLGVSHLAAEVVQSGMQFGIWVEPEMISEDSDLFCAHPEYRIAIPGRAPTVARHQYVLDFTRTEVIDCIWAQLKDLLSSAPITYVKWDMNRALTDAYSSSLPPARQGEFLHRYVLGVYDLMGRLTREFPHVLLENCSGGGGRFDCGMLRFSPQIWCSDDTDAQERVCIQYGTSLGFPVSSMGSHVSAVPNHQTWRSISFDTRAKIAMNGTFGYELNVNALSEEERAQIPAQCAYFRAHADLIQNGDLYRLCSPYESDRFAAWAYASADKKELLLFAYQSKGHANPVDLFLTLPADPSLTYTDEEGVTCGGDTLAHAGVRVHFGFGDHLAKTLYFSAKE